MPTRHRHTPSTRQAATPSALLLRLVQRARWLWLHWIEQRWAAFGRWRADRRAARAGAAALARRPDRLQIETLEPKLLLSADLLPADASQAALPTITQTLDAATAAALTAPVDMQLRAYDWKSHALLAGVSITPAGGAALATDASGTVTLPGLSNDTTALTVSRAVPGGEAAATAQAVNLQDAISVLRLVVGLDINPAGQALSPYQAIAADFDANGSVQLADAIGVLRNVVGLPGDAPRWTFLDEADTGAPARASLNPGLVADTVTVLSEAQGGLVAVLRGDVDGSWTPPLGSNTLDSAYFNGLVTKVNERAGSIVLSGSAWGVNPSLLRLNLDSASDTAPLGDMVTDAATVTLTGRTQAGVALALRQGDTLVAQATADANGAFSFANLALTVGANAYTLTLTNTAQASSTASVLVQRGAVNLNPPTLSAALRNDTGVSRADRYTQDATIDGTVQDNTAVAQLLAAIDGNTTLTNITDTLGAAGQDGIRSFSITPAQLAALAGGTLADGAHTLRLVAVDDEGHQSTAFELAFTLDTQAPTGTSFAVSSVDALAGDTSQTAASVVTIVGQTDPGASVALTDQNLRVVADGRGVFQMPGVALALGANALQLAVTDAGGLSATVASPLTRVAQTQADAVLDWTLTALNSIQRDVSEPTVATRILAIQGLAVYDTLAAIQGTPAFLVQRTDGAGADAQAAAAQAAYTVLHHFFPGQRSALDTALQTSLAAVANGDAKTAGIALGRSIALLVIAIRANDGAEMMTMTDEGGNALGQWRPTGPMYAVAEEPGWGSVTPFALSSGDQFRAPPPPALDSAEYAAAVAEVARLGSASSTSRSTDQTEQAHFWADGKGSYTPPGHWVQIATQIAQSQGNSLSANARMMAQLTVALADAAIACWDTKYAYDYWRPVTAIQLADQDGNAATNVDANWTPLLITPSHPSYVSGHSTFSAAGAGILASIFGDNVSFTTSSPTLLGVTRSYTSFSQASAEAGLSRIYGGIHYGFDNAQGNTIGSQVAAAVLARFALTEDLQAPDVVLQAVPAATNTNPTLRGQVLDNLSGVASATISIDGGTRVALTLAADGSFSFTPSLALDGSADGDHSYSIVAVDRAGNTSAALFGVFALDTTGPVLTLSSVADDASLSGAVRLTGIALGTGSAITQLSYRFNDSGPVYRVTPDAGTGAYDAALVYANLGYGAHVLTVEARDAAGNVATLTRNVRVDTLAPFNVAALTPADGFTDVGLTQRPLVTFSREVNLATLTADSFYATGPGGAKLAATIVPGGNGTWAWLFFDAPMPGSSQITVTVDGGLIRAAADGVFLDADGDGQAGGLRQTVFTTVGQTAVTGTKIIGRVVDPGPDLEPMTFDDIRRGADGVIHTADDQFLPPIAHAKVFILGRENAFVYTDDNGFFELDNVPAGTVKVAIDGRTATNAPQGVFFPEMVMNAELIAGTTNTLMGSMGSPAERVANADRSEVYLPRVANVVMQAVSDTQTTVITASDPAAAPGLTDEQRAQLTLTVAPGSAIGEDGQPLTGVQVGVATVPPELVRDMLPPGVLQHTFDITIQAPGVSAFTEPVAITMPNVFGAAPGTKVNILSFDHTTGLLVINGTGTVSADGLTVVSDEGSGVRAPGWHGVAPPGSPTDGPDNPPPQEPPPCISAKNAWDIIVDLSTAVAACAAELAGVRQAFYTALSIADKARELISQVQTVYDEAQKPGVSAAELAGYLKIVGNAKGIIVAAVEGVQRAANKPRQIAKCIEAILAGLDNICGRVQSQGDQCNTTLIKTVCIGIAAAKATLAQVNALIEAAEGSVRKLGLALVCSLIDKLGTLIGAAANAQPQGSMLMAPMALNLEDGSAARADGQPLDIAEIRRVCEQIIADLNAQSADMQTVQDFVVAYAALADETRKLDEDTAKIYSSFVSGLPANAFYLIRSEGLEMRGRTDGNGRLDVFLPPDADYTLQIYDATSNRIAQVVSHSAPSGSPTRIPALAFASLGLTSLPLDADGMRVIPAFMLPDGLGGILDTDGDGLADVAEDVIGTRIDLTDSDRDALTDLAEVQQGLNPLDGRLAATGVVGQVALQGTAKAVAVVASVDGQSRSNVLVATGSHGLAIVEATSADRPRLLAEIDLSGDSQDVVGDDARGLAAVAAGDTGLHLLDIANLGAPTLVQTVAFNGPVGHLALRDGMVYATVGADLAIVDIETGEIRTTQSVGGAALIGLSLDGDVLYTLDAANMLRSFSVIGDTFTALDTLTLDEGGGGLFVGGGVAYVGRGDSFAQGFQTVNTQDPANLVLISGIDSVGIAAQAMAANGSGWLVSVGNLVVGAGQAGYALDLVDVKDPTDTGKSLTRYTLPAAPRDLALANGLAFVADGTGGLQIVNYSSADRAGVAPTVSMAVSVIDADPNTDGVQVQEGQTLRIVPTVSDDTQVARVELLVNGQVVSNDPDFPFELFAAIPAIAIGGNTVTVQLRATDTGGNVGLSPLQTFQVVRDTFAPTVVSTNVAEGARRFAVRSFDILFNEPIDTSLLTIDRVRLSRAGTDGSFGTADDLTSLFRLSTRAQGQKLSIIPEGYLPPGDFELRLTKEMITDRVGNVLAADLVYHFTIRAASDVQAISGVPEISTAPSANPGQQIGIAVPFNPALARATFQVTTNGGNLTTQTVNAFRFDADRGIAYFLVPLGAVTGDCVVSSSDGTTFDDGTFPLQILPLITGVNIESVAADGLSAQVLISGVGFFDGAGSRYRFGTEEVSDSSNSTGPDVFGRNDSVLGSLPNGYVRLTIPLSAGAFGAISVSTAGGTSAAYTVSLASITGVAFSGTPADAGQASANAGQAITLVGAGLSTTTDVLLRFRDINGTVQMVRLSPTAAADDGSSATLVVPAFANGAFSLQILGSASQPLLQIVPTLTSFDQQSTLFLYGSGLVEDGTTYNFVGASASDTDTNIDIYYDSADQNRRAQLNRTALPVHGIGNVSVTTDGGTSAPLALNVVQVNATGSDLGDVAFDPASGNLWISDQGNPGKLQLINPATGLSVREITLTSTDFGQTHSYNHTGLQILPAPMTLGTTAVPAGSLLVFNGYANPDRVTAVNPSNGAVIASLALAGNFDLSSGLYDPTSGHLFISFNGGSGTELREINPATGAVLASITTPVNMQTWSGIAIDPVTNNLWIGSTQTGSTIVEITRTGTEVRRVSLASQGINQGEISGLSFDNAGNLWVASTQGQIYRVDLRVDTAAVVTPTLSSVLASAGSGVAANAAQASANVGQVIELEGTDFNAGTTVLFNTRNAEGQTALVPVTPLTINAAGTRMQVRVPDLASTGDIRVVNRGSANLGFNGSYVDSVYRQVTLSFTAGSSTAKIDFNDGGLEDLSNESWGIDNVRVRQGDTTVFADDFEGAANAAWRDATVDASSTATFTRFSGRFGTGKAGQTLNLSGLTAGQTYTLSFDFYAIDTWDGNASLNSGAGPDLFDVSVDGLSVLREAVSNYPESGAQTLRTSAGLRLQVVPTLTGIDGARPGSESLFNLRGSGFMEGASSVTIGGIVFNDAASNLSPLNVTGARNDAMNVAAPRTLDGPIRITTEGGYAQIDARFAPQPVSTFTAITATAALGAAGNPAQASTNTGQTIVLTGQGFTSSTLVQFQGIDDSGATGTITVTGTAGNNGTTLSVVVPALARTGNLTVLGSATSRTLQIVPVLRAVGGTVAAGNTIVLEGTGLSTNDLAITIDGRGVGSFSRRTVVDADSTGTDQQLITLVVPADVSTGVITISTAGGSSVLRPATTLADQGTLTPSAEVGNTLGTALDTGLGRDSVLQIQSAVAASISDIDLYRVDLAAGDQLTAHLSPVDYSHVRVFDATGTELQELYVDRGATAQISVQAGAVAGTYYVGVSGYYNNGYNPVDGSGAVNSYTGNYTLALESLRAGTSHLARIQASAASGTPTHAGVAAANNGQSITLHASGLRNNDRVVFTTIDNNGNLAEETVNPASLDLATQTITVVVPDRATTGRVRLERDVTGVLLQVVPVLNDIDMGNGNDFTGSNLRLNGRGFAEGATEVLVGAQRVADLARSSGPDSFYFSNAGRTDSAINLTVPAGMPTGPISVRTVGGTSAALPITLVSISASATSGTPASSSQASAIPGQSITLAGTGLGLGTELVFRTTDANGTTADIVVKPWAVNDSGTEAQVNVPVSATSGQVRVLGSGVSFNLQILPVIQDVQIESVDADGSSAQVLIAGSGFVEGGNSVYRFGEITVLDAGNGTGANVFGRNDSVLGSLPNGYVRLTIPLSAGAFGAISVSTAGGTSAAYTVSLASITGVAFSGTPADAGQASANAGQAITLVGAGLSTTTDVLLRFRDINGTVQMVRLSPTAAADDGSSATLVVPAYANGAFSLQILGSASQPLLQIVPTLTSFDQREDVLLYGSGLVENGSVYSFAGINVSDTDGNVDVYYDSVEQNRRAQLNRTALPVHGIGNVSVTTEGGTSAPLALNVVQVNAEGSNLGDVAFDPANGTLWVSDYTSPGHLLRIDAATGLALQTLTLNAGDFGQTYSYNHTGLQILPAPMTLGTTAVPAGSLLVFNGYANPDRVTAVNPTNGAVIASLALAGNFDLSSGLYDPTSGHLFISFNGGSGTELREINPATGAVLASITTPVNMQTWSGIAIDPVTNNLWIGSTQTGSTIVEITRTGTEVRRVSLASQGINQGEISGLSFDNAGNLWVASTQGQIYRVDLRVDTAAVVTPTLSSVLASAGSGVAANAAQASANVGQVIELEGTDFNAGTTVLFNTRNAEGQTALVPVTPLTINAAGTRMQVRVPDLASTGDIRVVNRGSANLGFNGSYVDSVYRQVTLSFTAGSSTAKIDFNDGGLEDLSNESWGIDNVRVRQGDTTVFADDFEGAANAAWRDATVDASSTATFTRFSGRFGTGKAGQTLNLSGLTAGQTYTLSFDFYAIDTWDGNASLNSGAGPDLFDVSVDGLSVLREAVSNYPESGAQTLRTSAGLRLQVVPTLTGIDGARPGSESLFNLRGSGFMEGASSVTIGGIVFNDAASNLSPLNVTGARNDAMNVAAPRTLDGPIRITTEGGYAQIDARFAPQPVSTFTAITATAALGAAGNPAQASTNTGQTIVLTGQGFTSSTLVQFQGIDDSGATGTITVTGTAGNNGTTLSVVVPALARTGNLTVLGSATSRTLQIVPVLRAVGGTVAAGNTIVLEGTGLSTNDLAITIDGRGVGSFSRRTVVDADSTGTDQQLITLVVPADVSTGVITISTAGGSSVLRPATTLADQGTLTPSAEVGNTLGTALDTGLGRDSVLQIQSAVAASISDIDLYRVDLAAGDQLTAHLSPVDYSHVRVFDATGTELQELYVDRGATAQISVQAGAVAGTYYVGVSGYYNNGYNPVDGSGAVNSYTGNYTLALESLRAGTSHLARIQASAASGTPTHAGVAAANNGQSITLHASGLRNNDRVVFTTIDNNGNLAEETVNPASLDLATQTITVVVPDRATTGRVRLERDVTGVLLQVVPVLNDIDMGNGNDFTGSNLRLNGRGFAEGATEVLVGAQRVADLARSSGPDSFYFSNAGRTDSAINLTVPAGMPTGPISVRTVGGTSAALPITLVSISASATSGTPASSSQASAIPGQSITLAGTGLGLGTELVFRTTDANGTTADIVVKPWAVNDSGTEAQVNVPVSATSGQVRVLGSGVSFNLQILPVIQDVQIESVDADGSSAQVLIAGSGFVEGGNSVYRFGEITVLDAGNGTGANVFGRNDSVLGSLPNGYVRLTIPLSAGAFGAISVSTAGGTSAAYTVSLASITGVAFSGTPADAGQASANAGQAITLVGAGLSTTTDVLLRFRDINGTVQMVRLSPTAAADDGSSATLVVPAYANGAFSLQILGSASQPLLQIVPTLTSFDQREDVLLYGSGLVENGSVYSFAGINVSDTDNNVDVYYDSVEQNRRAQLNRTALPVHGIGNVSVTTEGGTSAPLALNVVQVNAEGSHLGDVAFDPANGTLWVSDYTSPGHLLRIDAATGLALQTLTLNAGDFGQTYSYNHTGLQILPAPMTLGTTAVPAGSLLVFNGYANPDRVTAVNPSNGAVIASLALAGNFDLSSGLYDPTSGHLFISFNGGSGTELREINPATGAVLASITTPVNMQTWSGIAIDPVTNNLWIGSTQTGATIVEITRTGTEVRRISLASQGINQGEISGLSFDNAGNLWVASTQGQIYRVQVPAAT